MKGHAYLTINRKGIVKMTKDKPSLVNGQRAVRITVDVPDAAFNEPPILDADLRIPADALAKADQILAALPEPGADPTLSEEERTEMAKAICCEWAPNGKCQHPDECCFEPHLRDADAAFAALPPRFRTPSPDPTGNTVTDEVRT